MSRSDGVGCVAQGAALEGEIDWDAALASGALDATAPPAKAAPAAAVSSLSLIRTAAGAELTWLAAQELDDDGINWGSVDLAALESQAAMAVATVD